MSPTLVVYAPSARGDASLREAVRAGGPLRVVALAPQERPLGLAAASSRATGTACSASWPSRSWPGRGSGDGRRRGLAQLGRGLTAEVIDTVSRGRHGPGMATSKETAVSDITTLVDRYIAAWNEREPDRRRELVTDTFAEGASYVDPHRSGDGAEEIDAMIATAQGQFPGHRIELSFGPDAHNDRVRFAYRLVGPDGPVGGGTDFATVAPDGRLGSVTGFSDPAG